LAHILCTILDHIFNNHANCRQWFQRENEDISQTIMLTDDTLYGKLKEIFKKYANNASKFCVASSSQSNESVNNIIAHKAPKNIYLSKSEAADLLMPYAVKTMAKRLYCTF